MFFIQFDFMGIVSFLNGTLHRPCDNILFNFASFIQNKKKNDFHSSHTSSSSCSPDLFLQGITSIQRIHKFTSQFINSIPELENLIAVMLLSSGRIFIIKGTFCIKPKASKLYTMVVGIKSLLVHTLLRKVPSLSLCLPSRNYVSMMSSPYTSPFHLRLVLEGISKLLNKLPSLHINLLNNSDLGQHHVPLKDTSCRLLFACFGRSGKPSSWSSTYA